jgi:hypothetical protein
MMMLLAVPTASNSIQFSMNRSCRLPAHRRANGWTAIGNTLLIADTGYGFLDAHSRRDGFLQKKGQDMAASQTDFLADNDRDWGDPADFKRTLDGIMIRDRNTVDTNLCTPVEKPVGFYARIRGKTRMDMEIATDEFSRCLPVVHSGCCIVYDG